MNHATTSIHRFIFHPWIEELLSKAVYPISRPSRKGRSGVTTSKEALGSRRYTGFDEAGILLPENAQVAEADESKVSVSDASVLSAIMRK